MRFKSKEKAVFHDLAAKNVKRNARDYQIYFMTITLAVALFYTFNSIGAQFGILGIPDTWNFLSFSAGMMAGVSLFICLIMGFLVVYANRFMLKRRKREMGTYMTLGMELKDINALMWRETWLIGGGALLAGMAVGILFSQGLSLVTAKIIGVGLGNYHFFLSWKAVITAVFFFACMFFFVYRLNVKEIRKMELIQLLHAGSQNEKISVGKKRDIFCFILSVILLAAGYACSYLGMKIFFWTFLMPAVGLITAGTILFCLSFSGFWVRLCKKNKRYYYKKLHMFVVNQVGSKMKSAGISIGVVTVLISLSISSLTLGFGIGKELLQGKEQLAPYDISVRLKEEADIKRLETMTIEQVIEKKGLKMSDYVKNGAGFKIYTAEGITDRMFAGSLGMDEDAEEYGVFIIGLADYNKAMEIQGIAPVTLNEDEYAITYTSPGAKEQLEQYMRQAKEPLNVNGTELTLAKDGLYNHVYDDRNVLMDGGTLIVPQNVAEGLTVSWAVYNGMFQNEQSYTSLKEKYFGGGEKIEFSTKEDIAVEITSSNLMVTYIGVYLGITFLIVAGAVLALQQLSQFADNEKRYALLGKMGAKEKDLKGSVRTQLWMYFGLPFLLAAVNAAFITGSTYLNISAMTGGTVLQITAFSGGIVAAVYGLYFMVTYMGSRRILKLR